MLAGFPKSEGSDETDYVPFRVSQLSTNGACSVWTEDRACVFTSPTFETSMRAIARESGVGIATLYRHFQAASTARTTA